MSGAQEATLDPHTVAVVVEEEMREQAPVAVFGAPGSGELHAAADNEIAQRCGSVLLGRPGLCVGSQVG